VRRVGMCLLARVMIFGGGLLMEMNKRSFNEAQQQRPNREDGASGTHASSA